MFYKKYIFFTFLSGFLYAENNAINSKMKDFEGAWHLRVLDGMEVRKARVIFDFTFTSKKSKLSGFDGCNRISGDIKQSSETTLAIPLIMKTKMGCRGKMYRWTSKRVHQLLSEDFSIKEEKKYGVEGITIRSSKHELFFKKMQRG
ncbi:MAG: META domain-containing protein [Sulfurovum sp.]|nr:META domain-containing protein [Sulfurovum sp.]